MTLDKDGVVQALSAVGDQLAKSGSQGPGLTIVVCGGSALQVLGLIQNRTTRDVDVLAIASTSPDGLTAFLTAEPLPLQLSEAAAQVASDFGLPLDWLNSGPTDLLTEGMPDGFARRLHERQFGVDGKLTVLFADRVDQICLKAYAALNGGGARHLTDLRALMPTDDEMLFAARWTMTQDAADFFPELVRDFLRKIGYANVVDRL